MAPPRSQRQIVLVPRVRLWAARIPTALKINPFSAEDDGSCATLVVYGCLYAAASNFNTLANVDDGSCAFDDGAGDCATDIDGDGSTAVGDLLMLLGAFGLECQ